MLPSLAKWTLLFSLICSVLQFSEVRIEKMLNELLLETDTDRCQRRTLLSLHWGWLKDFFNNKSWAKASQILIINCRTDIYWMEPTTDKYDASYSKFIILKIVFFHLHIKAYIKMLGSNFPHLIFWYIQTFCDFFLTLYFLINWPFWAFIKTCNTPSNIIDALLFLLITAFLSDLT